MVKLSPRELEILALVEAGETNKRIAARLSLSENTIKAHLQRVYRRLGVANRTEAVARSNFWRNWTKQHSQALLACPHCGRWG